MSKLRIIEKKLRAQFKEQTGMDIEKSSGILPKITASAFTFGEPGSPSFVKVLETPEHRKILGAITKTADANVIASWGSDFHFWFVDYFGNPAVAFHVNGLLHYGYVVVHKFDEPGKYLVTLLTPETEKVQQFCSEEDSLGYAIDVAVERGKWSEKEYRCRAYSHSLGPKNEKKEEAILDNEPFALARICFKWMEHAKGAKYVMLG